MLPNSSDLSNYGGVKINYSPLENYQTDFDATILSQVLSDSASSTRTVPRTYFRITLAASTGALVLVSWDAVWKAVTPTAPVLSRTTTGVFTITVPAVVSDQWDAAQLPTPTINNNTVNLVSIYGVQLEGSTFGFAQASITSANVITLNTGNVAGSPNDLVGSTVNIVCR